MDTLTETYEETGQRSADEESFFNGGSDVDAEPGSKRKRSSDGRRGRGKKSRRDDNNGGSGKSNDKLASLLMFNFQLNPMLAPAKSSIDEYLTKLHGDEDDVSKCFLCNYKQGKYIVVSNDSVNRLNGIAYSNIHAGNLPAAIDDVHAEFEDIRKHVDDIIDNRGFSAEKIPEWKKCSIWKHYTVHDNSFQGMASKIMLLLNHSLEADSKIMVTKDATGKIYKNMEATREFNKTVSTYIKLASEIKKIRKL